MRRIVRRSVRAILLDEDDRLVLIKRIKSGQAPLLAGVQNGEMMR
ncbi:NUDIX hydrolase [Micromonospora andamanensis]|nr:hypothetical protein [Micromonospora andamanensis]